MPYGSVAELPKGVSELPKHAKEIYRSAFNAAYKKYGEEKAHKIAWGAVKTKYKNGEKGWTAKSELILLNKVEVKSIREGKTVPEQHVILTVASGKKDSYGDVFIKECLMDMAEQLKGKYSYGGSVKGSLDHEHIVMKSDLLPRAKCVDAYYDEALNGVIVDTILNPHHPDFAAVSGSIQDGFLDAGSIEFRCVDWNGERGIDRTIVKAEVTGWGYTGRPVNDECLILDSFAKSDFIDQLAHDTDFESAGFTDMIKQDFPAEKTMGVNMVDEAKSQPAAPAPAEDFKSKYEALAKELAEAKAKEAKQAEYKSLVEEMKSLVKEEIKSAVVQKPFPNEVDEAKSAAASVHIWDIATARNYKPAGVQ